jgi:DNA repair exonuclease SbcCD ATPase subunit
VKLRELRIEGFGKLEERSVVFDERFNVIVGSNEAGKSTLANAIVAVLFGVGRQRDAWRPWSGARYAAALQYVLEDGRRFEIQRDFERDPKGVRAYDESGNDVSAELTVGKVIIPGQAHLKIPLEVFVNAACVAQGSAEIDGARAERISTALAHALDGGPREDAALGALRRLDEALALHVGTKRATVNAPLRKLHESLAEADAEADGVRARLRGLDNVRARLEQERKRAHELERALREHERLARAYRAQTLQTRLVALREVRDTVAALHRERMLYDDVDEFPPGSLAQLEMRYHEWHTAETLSASAAEAAAETRLTPVLEVELSERLRDGGALDETAFRELEADVARAAEAHAKASFAANEAQSARRAVSGGNELFGAALAGGALVAVGAIVLAVLHDWFLAPLVGVVALALFAVAWSRWNGRRNALQKIAKMEQTADAAAKAERSAARGVAKVLEPLGVPSFEELSKRRERARELYERKLLAQRNAERAGTARAAAFASGRRYDDAVRALLEPSGSRDADLAAGRRLDQRRSARDGIDLQLSMLEVRRRDVLGDDEEYALDAELAALLGAGVDPAGVDRPPRAFAAEGDELERRRGDTRSTIAALDAELRTAEAQLDDLASLDERAGRLRAETASLERFEEALGLARRCIDERTREAHQKFARRLADYASRTLDGITGGRYADVRVDPTTLAVKVRAPETREIVEIDRLSSGTREQAYLVVRLAMVRMFAEGMETAPLLLDDPFAHWDEGRIERSFAVFEAVASGVQTILFTTQRPVADAAVARGARLIDLDATPAASAPAR